MGEPGEERGIAQGWELLGTMSWSLWTLEPPSRAFRDTCGRELDAGKTWRLSKENCCRPCSLKVNTETMFGMQDFYRD